MKKTIKSTLVLCLLFIGSFSVSAQPGDPPNPDGESNPVPISGIGYLVAAGALFGVKKIYDKKK
ncbi:hypothetical protein QYS49_38225 [Marivirga salinae]|uniref:Signal peptidase n=1 Tax=Marivirga salinarum TaxID=3059078 RepID=A0AA51N9Q2_9BACT|nr:hypothetical protein [Marivirga sp. BDSF4-3]WMN11392.1 hypothetical protein QYS49_38225 [Marivirga sp. BDSF4-3]